ncbi:MAG: hypothetical protein AAB268_05935 [Elusimicrobiota bacterium]|jgi:hypothetical protein
MAIEVNDRVQIIKAPQDQPGLLNQAGKVMMITDETNYLVQLDNGEAANVTADQLKKLEN